MYFRTRVQLPAPPILSEGLRPSDSPTRALARRFAARSVPVARSLRSLAMLARFAPGTPLRAHSLALRARIRARDRARFARAVSKAERFPPAARLGSLRYARAPPLAPLRSRLV